MQANPEPLAEFCGNLMVQMAKQLHLRMFWVKYILYSGDILDGRGVFSCAFAAYVQSNTGIAGEKGAIFLLRL